MRAKITAKEMPKYKAKATPYEVNDTELRGFCLRVMPTGAATYFLRYRLPNGKRGRVKIGSAALLTPVQAREEAIQKGARASRGDDPAQVRKQGVPLTLGAFVEQEFYPLWLKPKRTGEATYKNMQKFLKALWNVPLPEITPGKVEKWRAGILAKGRKVTTANRHLDALRCALNRAVDWDRLAFNPIAKVRRLKWDKSPKVRFLSADEETRLMAALDAREEELRAGRDSANVWRRDRKYPELPDLRRLAFADHLKPAIIVSLNAGLRRGELFNLVWGDIDFEHAYLTVRGEGAKSGQSRHVPMNSLVLETLKAWHAQVPWHGYVFPSATGGRLDNAKTSWEGVVEKAGIKPFRWHDMRHHFASRLVMAGVDLNSVRELLGHADVSMTIRYAHLAPEHKAEAVERIVAPRGTIVQFPRGNK